MVWLLWRSCYISCYGGCCGSCYAMVATGAVSESFCDLCYIVVARAVSMKFLW